MAKKDINYQQKSQQLEELIDKLQDPLSDIDESLKNYEQGIIIIKELQSYLKNAENKINQLNKDSASS